MVKIKSSYFLVIIDNGKILHSEHVFPIEHGGFPLQCSSTKE